jgi:hypothetical protein
VLVTVIKCEKIEIELIMFLIRVAKFFQADRPGPGRRVLIEPVFLTVPDKMEHFPKSAFPPWTLLVLSGEVFSGKPLALSSTRRFTL